MLLSKKNASKQRSYEIFCNLAFYLKSQECPSTKFRRLLSGPREGHSYLLAGLVLSKANWSAFLRLASLLSNEADRASMVLEPFAGTKGSRLLGRNPENQKITLMQELVKQVCRDYILTLFDWQNSTEILIAKVRLRRE